MSPNLPPLDGNILNRLRRSMGNHAAIALPKLIDCYLSEAPQQIQAMQQAVAAQDAQRLKQAAHTLKSSSAALGSPILFDLCKTLEELGQMGTIAPAVEALLILEQEFERFKAALERERH